MINQGKYDLELITKIGLNDGRITVTTMEQSLKLTFVEYKRAFGLHSDDVFIEKC